VDAPRIRRPARARARSRPRPLRLTEAKQRLLGSWPPCDAGAQARCHGVPRRSARLGKTTVRSIAAACGRPFAAVPRRWRAKRS
jgi:hypothetical protein